MYTNTQAISLSLSLSLYHTHIYTHTHTGLLPSEISVSSGKVKETYYRGKRDLLTHSCTYTQGYCLRRSQFLSLSLMCLCGGCSGGRLRNHTFCRRRLDGINCRPRFEHTGLFGLAPSGLSLSLSLSLSHTHTHTHTHTLSLSLSRARARSFALSFFLSRALSLSRSSALSFFLSLSLSFYE
jgi:hypothetical protein